MFDFIRFVSGVENKEGLPNKGKDFYDKSSHLVDDDDLTLNSELEWLQEKEEI